MADDNNTGAAPGATGAAGATTGTTTGAGATGTTGAAPARPEYLPENFWDATKGQPNVEGLARDYTKLQTEHTELKGKVTTPPEKYDLKLPDGALLPANAIERTAATAKALGLSQEQATQLLAHEAGTVKAYYDDLTKDHVTRTEQWLTEARGDRDIAGERGELFDANAAKAKQTFTQWFGADVAKLMDQTGFGNHPGVIKGFLKIAKAMAEDNPSPPANPGGKGELDAKSMYPNSNMN